MRARLAALFVLGAAGGWTIAQVGCSSSSTPPPPVATGSGAFGVVTVNGKQVMYLPLTSLSPAGNGQIAVVDVGIVPAPGHNVDDAGTPALVTNIDLGTFDQATATAGDSSVVVAAGTATHKVWFIDPSTNKVVHTTELDPNLTGGSFSGGGGIVDGIAIDEANHRAILSVWNGFQFIDLGNYQVTGYVLAAGAENFGYDSTKQYLLSPFYDCQPGIEFVDAGTPATQAPPCDSYVTPGDAGLVISDGFNLIDISKSSAVVYTYESSAPDSGIASDPVGFSPDSAAIDTTTGIAMISSEGSSFYTFLDLSKAVFSKGPPATFTAPSTVLVPSAGADDGVSIEPVSHIAFTEQEFSNHVSVINLNKITPGTGFPPSAFADATLPTLPDGFEWSNLGDPHGIAVTTGIQTNGPVGFVVTDQGGSDVWVARIDLNKFLALGAAAAADGGATTLEGDAFAPAVTFLDATRKE